MYKYQLRRKEDGSYEQSYGRESRIEVIMLIAPNALTIN